MPRFVVLEHHWNGVHWDLMLEAGTVLRTWAIEELPEPGRHLPARKLADHRLLYLDYEGEIGGARGFVRRWDCGTFDWREDTQRHVAVELCGSRLRGPAYLSAGESDGWSFWLEPASGSTMRAT
jgi:hypothetical protein